MFVGWSASSTFSDASARETVDELLKFRRRVPFSHPTLYRLLETLIAKGLVRAEGEA
jgi:DNA-binding IclR family transcriptional regulator